MEALISGHPWGFKKVPITGTGCLQECKNTEFVWELRKMELILAHFLQVTARFVPEECPGVLAL